MIKKLLLITFAGLWTLGTVFAEPVSLQFWNGFTGPDGRYIQRIIDDFNRERAGEIRVRMVVMPWDDFYAKVALALRTKRAPDIGLVHYDNVYNVIYQGIVEELDPYLDQFPLADFVESALKVSQQNGHQYGIPLDFHPMVLYWNRDLFREVGLDPDRPPRDRKEFLEACRVVREAALEKNGQRVWPCMIPATHPNFLIWQHVFFCNGGRMFREDFKRATYDTEAGKDALGFLRDMVYQYEYSSPNVTDNECMESFRRGTSAMHINGVWMLTSFKESQHLTFGARAMPNVGSDSHRVWSGSHTLVLFRKRRPDPVKTRAAVAFLKYLSEHSLEWARSGMIPARYSIVRSPEFRALPYLRDIALDIERFAFPVPHYRYIESIVPLRDEITLCLLKRAEPEAALRKAADMSNRQLAQDPD